MQQNRTPTLGKFSNTLIHMACKTSFHAAGFYSRWLETKYGKLHYYDSHPNSTEAPCILVHGIGVNAHAFAFLGPMLVGRRRTVIPDLFNFSGLSQSEHKFTFRCHLETMENLISHIQSPTVTLVGFSLGGWISTKLAAKFPHVVSDLILMNPAGMSPKAESVKDFFQSLNWKNYLQNYENILKQPSFSKFTMFNKLIRRDLFTMISQSSVKQVLDSLSNADFVENEASKLKQPSLLLWGECDKLLPIEFAYSYAALLRNVDAKFIRNCAHSINLEAPVDVYENIVRFTKTESVQDNVFTKWVIRNVPRHGVYDVKVPESKTTGSEQSSLFLHSV